MLRQITILGSGTMGRGIAYLAVVAGYDTVLHDLSAAALESAGNAVRSLIAKGLEKKKLTEETARAAAAKLSLIVDLEPAAAGADLIIEAVPENLELKLNLFSQADLFCSEEAILVSNTSSMSISQLSGSVERRDQFAGMHFFNPPHAMKLVEIVRGDRTSDATVDALREVADRMGKTSIVVRDAPGFATSRLGVALCLEAIRMVEQGVASVEDIDRATELGFNHPMGPLRLTDLIGLDVQLGVAEYLHETLGGRFEPPHLLRDKVRRGELGQKSGEGFYVWNDRE